MEAQSVRPIQKLRSFRRDAADVKAASHEFFQQPSFKNMKRLVQLLLTGELTRLVARLLICSYFLNLVYAAVETWQHLHTIESQKKFMRWQDPGLELHELPFPWFYACILLPAALLTAAGVMLPWLFSGMLLVFIIWRDARLTWAMVQNIILHGYQPTELLMKQLAVIGSTLLVFAYSVKEVPQVRRATAGLLYADDGPRQHRLGVKRSAALLLSRLLLSGLLLFAGYNQVLRIKQRLEAGPQQQQHHYGRPDARDNNWLLLECALAVPLALGLWTGDVSVSLSLALLGEALMHWGWWGSDWPSWHYRQNVRDHFFTNTAVAGGLLLMQSFGGGVLTVDALLQRKQE